MVVNSLVASLHNQRTKIHIGLVKQFAPLTNLMGSKMLETKSASWWHRKQPKSPSTLLDILRWP
jgi:hypothetical protein